jgi:hypothetical protein
MNVSHAFGKKYVGNKSGWWLLSCTSSSSNASSSKSMYREKSFLRIRNIIIVKKAVNSKTKTNELIIDSQCISNDAGKKRLSVYRECRSFHSIDSLYHSTEYEYFTSIDSFTFVISTLRDNWERMKDNAHV